MMLHPSHSLRGEVSKARHVQPKIWILHNKIVCMNSIKYTRLESKPIKFVLGKKYFDLPIDLVSHAVTIIKTDPSPLVFLWEKN